MQLSRNQLNKLKYISRSKKVLGRWKDVILDINQDYKIDDKRNLIYIVADGMGANSNSQDLSMFAAEMLKDKIKGLVTGLRNFKEDSDETIFTREDINNQIISHINTTNKHINTLVEKDNFYIGAGTTLSLAFIHRDVAYIYNLGDSRVYLAKNNGFHQLTKDDHHLLTDYPLEHRTAPLTQYLGKKNVTPHLAEVLMEPGDRILLVTDGITKYVHNDEIQKILLNEDLNKISSRLIQTAYHPQKMRELYAESNNISKRKAMQTFREETGDNISLIAIQAEAKK